jgi:hypothetical protein
MAHGTQGIGGGRSSSGGGGPTPAPRMTISGARASPDDDSIRIDGADTCVIRFVERADGLVPTHRPLMIAEREVTITRAETVPGECRGGLQGSGLACLCVLVLDLINSAHWIHHTHTHTHTHTHIHTHTHTHAPHALPNRDAYRPCAPHQPSKIRGSPLFFEFQVRHQTRNQVQVCWRRRGRRPSGRPSPSSRERECVAKGLHCATLVCCCVVRGVFARIASLSCGLLQ